MTQQTDRVRKRLQRIDWPGVEEALGRDGYALTPTLLSARERRELIALYADESRFRSYVDMERHRFGVGSYRYFSSPLPTLVETLRNELYPDLAAIANAWNRALGVKTAYPERWSRMQAHCHAHGQRRPTPLLLRYEAGGYNCLHQDRYGEVAFPLQATILLSRPSVDFEGGEFLLVEQRPRMQSRGEAIRLEAGQAIFFPNSQRPVQGRKGTLRVNTRHGVSRVRFGVRYALGIIFHDAA